MKILTDIKDQVRVVKQARFNIIKERKEFKKMKLNERDLQGFCPYTEYFGEVRDRYFFNYRQFLANKIRVCIFCSKIVNRRDGLLDKNGEQIKKYLNNDKDKFHGFTGVGITCPCNQGPEYGNKIRELFWKNTSQILKDYYKK